MVMDHAQSSNGLCSQYMWAGQQPSRGLSLSRRVPAQLPARAGCLGPSCCLPLRSHGCGAAPCAAGQPPHSKAAASGCRPPGRRAPPASWLQPPQRPSCRAEAASLQEAVHKGAVQVDAPAQADGAHIKVGQALGLLVVVAHHHQVELQWRAGGAARGRGCEPAGASQMRGQQHNRMVVPPEVLRSATGPAAASTLARLHTESRRAAAQAHVIKGDGCLSRVRARRQVSRVECQVSSGGQQVKTSQSGRQVQLVTNVLAACTQERRMQEMRRQGSA